MNLPFKRQVPVKHADGRAPSRPPCEHPFVGAAGSPGGAFQRACQRGNVLMALAAVEDLPKPLVLDYALTLTALFARVGDERFDAAAARLPARLLEERRLSLPAARVALEALVALPDAAAERVLRELVR